MLSERELAAAIGTNAYGPDGDRIGTVEHFFTDDRTGAPTWVAVSTGLFGTRHSVVPAAEAVLDEGGLRLPVTREAVRNAPQVGDEHLDPEAETVLRRHYGLEHGEVAGSGTGSAPPDPAAPVPGAAVAAAGPAAAAAGPAAAHTAPTGPPDDGAMTRSEERLHVRTEQVADRRVRLVKYVVTEEVQLTVPVRREEIRVEEVPNDAPDPGPGESLVPGDAGNGAGGGTQLPGEIVLHAERPVVSVEVVPVERVRLRTEMVEGREQVSDQVRREQIVVDEDARRS